MAQGRLRLIDRIRRTKVYRPGAYKTLPKRLNWEQIEAKPPKEKHNVVKGTSKRVVVVKSPDPKVFEEAIFIVKEDFLGRSGRANALKEAQQVANAYIRGAVASPTRKRKLPPLAWAVIGALVSGAVFCLLYFL
jgi:hypothetical protein